MLPGFSQAVQQPASLTDVPSTTSPAQILAVASSTFTVVASDTRQSEGYSIQTRYAPSVFRL